jgi:hypothetical protein
MKEETSMKTPLRLAAILTLSGVACVPAATPEDRSPLQPIVSAYWLGSPDVPDTNVFFTFSKATDCSQLQMPAWETRVMNDTQALELITMGTAVGTFDVVLSNFPVPGQALVTRLLTKTSGTPPESAGTKGTVTVIELQPGTSAKGSFSVSLGDVAITDSFDAVFCPGGHEP